MRQGVGTQLDVCSIQSVRRAEFLLFFFERVLNTSVKRAVITSLSFFSFSLFLDVCSIQSVERAIIFLLVFPFFFPFSLPFISNSSNIIVIGSSNCA